MAIEVMSCDCVPAPRNYTQCTHLHVLVGCTASRSIISYHRICFCCFLFPVIGPLSSLVPATISSNIFVFPFPCDWSFVFLGFLRLSTAFYGLVRFLRPSTAFLRRFTALYGFVRLSTAFYGLVRFFTAFYGLLRLSTAFLRLC